MNKVFAVLIFLVFTVTCLVNNNPDPLHLESGDVILYTSPGNFDQDKYLEYTHLIKTSNGELFFRMVDEDRIYDSDVVPDTLNHWESINDVNRDGVDDIVLCTTGKDKEDLFIFTFNNGLKTIFSPEIANRYFNSRDAKAVFSSLNDVDDSSRKELVYECRYIEMAYDPAGPCFTSEGTVTSGEKVLSSINSILSIDSSNNIIIKASGNQ